MQKLSEWLMLSRAIRILPNIQCHLNAASKFTDFNQLSAFIPSSLRATCFRVCATAYGLPLQKFKTSREREKVKEGVDRRASIRGWSGGGSVESPVRPRWSLVSQSPGQLTIDLAVN